jgi:hypothetical protein
MASKLSDEKYHIFVHVFLCTCGKVFGAENRAKTHAENMPDEEQHLYRKVNIE